MEISTVTMQQVVVKEATNLANVATMPGQIKMTLASARPFVRYFNGTPPESASSLDAVTESVPVKYADLVARMMVNAMASERVNMHARTEQTRHAILTDVDSLRSGQKRSKKKAEPNMVATYTPTKMLKDAMPTKSLLCTVTPGDFEATYCC